MRVRDVAFWECASFALVSTEFHSDSANKLTMSFNLVLYIDIQMNLDTSIPTVPDLWVVPYALFELAFRDGGNFTSKLPITICEISFLCAWGVVEGGVIDNLINAGGRAGNL